ncbi:Oidioi.mRNA.OKI2018_I69.chr2.g4898.t1.cds [Oikopleura dioica]|uniref:Oidioi.mRNA.OKI2018_I69.chr2.g4898.t1.cds n=1 Tax=Oikopleura dioica TaxID=34765 RepID=A0ABN7SYP7_OIKDI|nr:Oidioi.mRNA.OKI2018_I69.chr2.g4898.t1.cds [Oikopleura dioica]
MSTTSESDDDFDLPPLAGESFGLKVEENHHVESGFLAEELKDLHLKIPLAGETIVFLSTPARKLSDKIFEKKSDVPQGKFVDEDFKVKDGERLSSMKIRASMKKFQKVDEGEGGPKNKHQNEVKDDIASKVLQIDKNSSDEAHALGKYHFNFYDVHGWQKVMIDDYLPQKIAEQSKDHEWWVPLVEKAYAKFHGGYDRLEGGNTNWSLTELCGGICCEMKNLREEIELENVLLAIKNHSLICCSNLDEEDNSTIIKGLVSSHAYAVLRIEKMILRTGEYQTMIKLRNPWGKTEWTGNWSDDDRENWRRVRKKEKKRIGFTKANDGAFWMSYEDWLKELEIFNFCALPGLDINDEDGIFTKEEARDREIIVSGEFISGINSPRDSNHIFKAFLDSKYNAQVVFNVGTNSRDPNQKSRYVWLQFLLESSISTKSQVILDVYKINEDRKFDKEDLKRMRDKKVLPVIPLSKGYELENYKHNGYLFSLKPGKYLITFAAVKNNNPEKFQWKLRAFGSDLSFKNL